MDFTTHFLAAVLIARGMKYKHNQFESFFLGIAGCLPDIDSIAAPWGYHGTYTHTIIFGILLAFAYSEFTMKIGRKLMAQLNLKFIRLFALAVLGVFIHLLLDVDTLSSYPCTTTIEHMYFWPIWRLSFQGDCLMPGFQMMQRNLIEFPFLAILLIVFAIRWKKYKEPFYEIFLKSHWKKYSIESKILSE
jgi:hypothetical protein